MVERYGINGNHAQGFISGWNFQKGAIATTAAPDMLTGRKWGAQLRYMALAANTLIERGGGQVVVIDGQVVAYLALPVAGIASDLTPEELAQKEQELNNLLNKLVVSCQIQSFICHSCQLPLFQI